MSCKHKSIIGGGNDAFNTFFSETIESSFQDAFSLILNQLSLMKLEMEPTDNSSIQNNSSQDKRMPPTTSPEEIATLVKKLSIFALTESESLLINAQISGFEKSFHESEY